MRSFTIIRGSRPSLPRPTRKAAAWNQPLRKSSPGMRWKWMGRKPAAWLPELSRPVPKIQTVHAEVHREFPVRLHSRSEAALEGSGCTPSDEPGRADRSSRQCPAFLRQTEMVTVRLHRARHRPLLLRILHTL